MCLSETSRSTTTRILYPPISPFKFLLNFPNSFFFSRVTLRPIISLGIITRRGSKRPSFPSKRDPLTPASSRPSQKNPVDRRNRPSRASIVLSQFRRVFFLFFSDFRALSNFPPAIILSTRVAAKNTLVNRETYEPRRGGCSWKMNSLLVQLIRIALLFLKKKKK